MTVDLDTWYAKSDGRPCEFRNGSCYHERPAVHIMLKSVPAGSKGTHLCAYHSPWDYTPLVDDPWIDYSEADR
jgi:hypothetical protein